MWATEGTVRCGRQEGMGKKKGKKLTVEPLPEVDSAGDDAFWDMIDSSAAPEPEPEPPVPEPEPDPAAEEGDKKAPSKASRRRAAKADKEAEEARQQRAAAIAALKEGPGKGERETATLAEQLGKLGKRVLEVSPDGDCLYASVAHQLSPGVLNRMLPGGETPSATALRTRTTTTAPSFPCARSPANCHRDTMARRFACPQWWESTCGLTGLSSSRSLTWSSWARRLPKVTAEMHSRHTASAWWRRTSGEGSLSYRRWCRSCVLA